VLKEGRRWPAPREVHRTIERVAKDPIMDPMQRAKNQPTFLILVGGKHPAPPVHVVQSELGMSFQSCGFLLCMLSHGIYTSRPSSSSLALESILLRLCTWFSQS